jgi:hypothetical protein
MTSTFIFFLREKTFRIGMFTASYFITIAIFHIITPSLLAAITSTTVVIIFSYRAVLPGIYDILMNGLKTVTRATQNLTFH